MAISVLECLIKRFESHLAGKGYHIWWVEVCACWETTVMANLGLDIHTTSDNFLFHYIYILIKQRCLQLFQMLQPSTSHLNLSQYLNLRDFFYSIHTILKCRLNAFPIPEPINLNWITVLFKLLHFGDASNDLWERIVNNISQSVGGKRRLALQRARRVSGLLLGPAILIHTGEEELELELEGKMSSSLDPNTADSSQSRWKRDLIRLYSRWNKSSWEMGVHLHAERNRKLHWLISSRGHPGPSTPERRDKEKKQLQ